MERRTRLSSLLGVNLLLLVTTSRHRSAVPSFAFASAFAHRRFVVNCVVDGVCCRSNRHRRAIAIIPPSTTPRGASRTMMTTTTKADQYPSLEEGGEDSSMGLSDIGRPLSSNSSSHSRPSIHWKGSIDASIARSRKIRGSNYVQISTIDIPSMEPRCRTVVFRGFLRDVPRGAIARALAGYDDDDDDDGIIPGSDFVEYGDCVMKMITDARSNKVREASSGDVAELVWWFPKSSEQYRIRGRLHFVGNDDSTSTTMTTTGTAASEISEYFRKERGQVWGNLSDMAREQFHWDDPGLPFVPSSDDAVSTRPPPPAGGRDVDGRVLSPPDNFLLMLLYPFRVDYLRLTDNYRQVDEWDGSGGRGVGTRALYRDEGEDDGVRDDNDGDEDGDDDCVSMCHWKSMRVNP